LAASHKALHRQLPQALLAASAWGICTVRLVSDARDSALHRALFSQAAWHQRGSDPLTGRSPHAACTLMNLA